MEIAPLSEKLRLQSTLDIHLFDIAGTAITVATLVAFALVVLASFLISWITQRALVRLLKARGVSDQGTLEVAQRLSHYAIMAIGLGVGIQTIGIDLTALFAAGALFAVAVGFAMQNLSQNFVSGLILLMERSIKPGDVLKVEGQFVKVTKMGMRATQARSLDDEEIIVPNSTIVQGTVTNYTLRDSYYRLRCPVGVTYDSDMRLVRKTLEEAVRDLAWRSPDHEPVVLLTDFGNSSVNFEASVWIDDPWIIRRRMSDMYDKIWWALKDAGIVIAFPQLDVHFDKNVVETWSGQAAS